MGAVRSATGAEVQDATQTTGQGGSEAPDRYKRLVLIVCCIAQFMVILDLSIVNVALPSIQVGLRFSSADLQWVVDAYAIVFAGFLMLCGRAVDIFGQRRAFLSALVVFSVASLAGGLAPTSTALIVARAIQGLGGAMMAACSLAIITSTFTAGAERHRAVALWGAMNGAGGAVGTLLSGIITQELSWRWVLLINAPIGLMTAVAAAGLIVERRSSDRKAFDLPGALVLTLGLLLNAYGAVNAGTDGWGSAAALVPIGVGSALLFMFPIVERRVAAPLIPAGAFTKALKNINLIVLLFSAALFPMWYMSSLYLQQVLSLSPIATGLCFLPMTLAIMACASRAGALVGRFGVRPILGSGLILMTCGLALFGRISASGSPLQYVILPGVLTTIGIGFSIVPSTIAATRGAEPHQAGFASGLVNTSRQVGGGLGLAVLVSIATLYTTHLIGHNQAAPQALTNGFRLAFLLSACLCAAAAALTFILLPSERQGEHPVQRPLPVTAALAATLVVFAIVGIGIPRSQGAALGAYTTRGTYSFVTAPTLHPPKLQGGPAKAGKQLPGDLLLANFYDLTNPPIVGQSGPLIVGGDLQPIWFKPVPTDVVASNLTEQRYQGKPVLSWWQGNLTATGQTNSGEDIVVNQHYRQVAKLKGADGWVLTLHEMVIRGHYAWVTADKNVPADLAADGGVNGGAIVDAAVQKYDLRTGRLVYSWDALKHIPAADSETQPPANGFPWDAYHVNSIDPLGNGKFLVSMRNTWAGYLVDIRTGRIEWTLGGKHSSFTVPSSAHFEWQHDMQAVNSSTVSLFDDHCCDITGAGTYLDATGPSRGLILRLDANNHTVKLVHQYSHGTSFESDYMGNVQLLSNGNVFVGWGEVPYGSEFTKSGKLLFDMVMPTPDMSYRIYVRRWVGKPLSSPAGAARKTGGSTTVYVSWNGATQVRTWKVLALGASPTAAHAKAIAHRARSGFETAIPVRSTATHFEVQALNRAGKVIGTSRPFTTSG